MGRANAEPPIGNGQWYFEATICRGNGRTLHESIVIRDDYEQLVGVSTCLVLSLDESTLNGLAAPIRDRAHHFRKLHERYPCNFLGRDSNLRIYSNIALASDHVLLNSHSDADKLSLTTGIGKIDLPSPSRHLLNLYARNRASGRICDNHHGMSVGRRARKFLDLAAHRQGRRLLGHGRPDRLRGNRAIASPAQHDNSRYREHAQGNDPYCSVHGIPLHSRHIPTETSTSRT